MRETVKLADLAARWKTYPRLLEGLCHRAEIPVRREPAGHRARVIDRVHEPKLHLFLVTYWRLSGASKKRSRSTPSVPSALLT